MLAIKETLDKIQTLDEDSVAIVVNLVDYLSAKNSKNGSEEENPFRAAWKEGSRTPMTEEEIDDFVNSVRGDRHATRS